MKSLNWISRNGGQEHFLCFEDGRVLASIIKKVSLEASIRKPYFRENYISLEDAKKGIEARLKDYRLENNLIVGFAFSMLIWFIYYTREDIIRIFNLI